VDGEEKIRLIFSLKNLKQGKEHLGYLGVFAGIILNCVLQKYLMRVWYEFILCRVRLSGGSCEHGCGTSRSIKGGQFLGQQSDF
jgi:hypothetical protein